jgi:Tol biopolymer transport system component
MTAAQGTQLGVILGTAAYMSPEQARGGAVDKRADIWAFGVVLFEMLSGRPLFAADTVSDTLAGVLKTEVDFGALPAATPPALRQLLRRCLDRSPKNRLHDIADARIVLDDLISGASGGAASPDPGPAAPARGVSLRERAAWGVALVATVAAVFLAAGRLRSGEGPVPPEPQTVRFSFVPPGEGTIEGFPAVSPDGRTLVYAQQQQDGSTTLIAQSLESGTGRTLPGTNGGEQPFWSPDGRQLAFFAGGQLKRLDVASGLVQNLYRVADARGGAWTGEGDVLVSVNSASPIIRVSQAGEGRAVTHLATDQGEQSHRFPLALPGGGFLYTCTGGLKRPGIYWVAGPDATPRRLLQDLSRTAFDARGFLLWVRDGILVSQRFDARRGELSGDVVPVAEGIGTDAQRTASSWFAASATGTIAVRKGTEQRSELVWFDRKGALLGRLASAGSYREPSISPDGRLVVVGTEASTEVPNLWVYEASGLDRARRLTFHAAGGETGVISRDGRWVAYTSARETGFTVIRKSVDGSGEEESLFEAGSGTWVDDWSADGRSLLIERFSPEKGSDLWILPLDGSRKAAPFLETPVNEGHAVISPDGRYVAYVSDEGGLAQIFVRPFPAGGGRWQVSRNGGDWPAFSPDGRQLYFAGLDRILYSVPIASLSPFTFGSPEPLFRLRVPQPAITSNRTYFAPAPDGRRFLVNQLVGTEGTNRIDVVVGWSPRERTR